MRTQSKLIMKNLEKRHKRSRWFLNWQFDKKSIDKGLIRTEMQSFKLAIELAQKEKGKRDEVH